MAQLELLERFCHQICHEVRVSPGALAWLFESEQEPFFDEAQAHRAGQHGEALEEVMRQGRVLLKKESEFLAGRLFETLPKDSTQDGLMPWTFDGHDEQELGVKSMLVALPQAKDVVFDTSWQFLERDAPQPVEVHRLYHVQCPHLRDLVDEGVFGFEVVIEAGLAHPHARSEFAKGRAGDAMFCDEFECRFQDELALRFALFPFGGVRHLGRVVGHLSLIEASRP